jgi:hypothetical protein
MGSNESRMCGQAFRSCIYAARAATASIVIAARRDRHADSALRAMLLIAVLAATSACGERSANDAERAAAEVASARDTNLPPPAADEAAKPAGAAAIVGRTMPPYPEGLAEVQGVCVPGGEDPERICDFGIAVLGRETTENSPGIYLVASRNAEPDAQYPLWKITDALDAPTANAGHELQLGGCRLDGELRSDVVALVRHGSTEYSADIGWAKRLNIETGKFVDVELGRVDCIDPGFGV